jgi:hypothetical protein
LLKSTDRYRKIHMSALQGGFNWSMQHTNHRVGGRSVANEAATTDLLFQ